MQRVPRDRIDMTVAVRDHRTLQPDRLVRLHEPQVAGIVDREQVNVLVANPVQERPGGIHEKIFSAPARIVDNREFAAIFK